MKLTNIPSSFDGNRYRCKINGFVYGDLYALKIQNTRQGSVSSQWENPLNWSCGVLPDPNTNVVITNGNIFLNINTTISTLTLSSGAHLTNAAGVTLTILK